MKNRLTGLDDDDRRGNAFGLETLHAFMKLPGMSGLFSVFSGILDEAGWNKIPASLAGLATFTVQSFMLQAWLVEFGAKKPVEVLDDVDGRIGSVMRRLFITISDKVIDDFMVKVPTAYAKFAEVWPSEPAFKQPWKDAAKLVDKVDKDANKLEELCDKVYAAKSPVDCLTTRLECFKQWKGLQPFDNGAFDGFFYIGSVSSGQEARTMVLNEITKSVGERQDTSTKVFFCGELSASGLVLLQQARRACREKNTLDEDQITFEVNPITVMGHSVIRAEERLTIIVQSAHITHAMLRMAASGLYTKIDCVTQSLIGAMLAVEEADSTRSLLANGDAALKNLQAGNIDLTNVQLVAYTWSQEHGFAATQMDMLKATQTADGYAFSEHPGEHGRFDFSNKEAVSGETWKWANGISKRDPEYLDKARQYGVFTGDDVLIDIGMPLALDQDIF